MHHPDKGGDAETFKELNNLFEVYRDKDAFNLYLRSIPFFRDLTTDTDRQKFQLNFPVAEQIFAEAKASWEARDLEVAAHAEGLKKKIAEEEESIGSSVLPIVMVGDGNLVHYLTSRNGVDLIYNGRDECLDEHRFVLYGLGTLRQERSKELEQSRQALKVAMATHKNNHATYLLSRQHRPPPKVAPPVARGPLPPVARRDSSDLERPAKRRKPAPAFQIGSSREQQARCPACRKFPEGFGCYRHKSTEQLANIRQGIPFGITSTGAFCTSCIRHGDYCKNHEYQRPPNFTGHSFHFNNVNNNNMFGHSYTNNMFGHNYTNNMFGHSYTNNMFGHNYTNNMFGHNYGNNNVHFPF